MANEVMVSKAVAFILLGEDNVVSASKVVAFMVLEPGAEEEDTSNRQGHSFSTKVRKPRGNR